MVMTSNFEPSRYYAQKLITMSSNLDVLLCGNQNTARNRKHDQEYFL